MNKVKLYRTLKGFTQEQLAEELREKFPGITRPVISFMETGVVDIPKGIENYIDEQSEIDVCIQAKMAPVAQENLTLDKSIEWDEKSRIASKNGIKVYEMLLDLSEGERLTRSELVRTLNLPDRTCREIIEGLRKAGVWVCSDRGYYLARDFEEYKAWEKIYLSRAYQALATARAMRNNKTGQMELSNG